MSRAEPSLLNEPAKSLRAVKSAASPRKKSYPSAVKSLGFGDRLVIAQTFTCTQGHQFVPPEGDNPVASCPVCGEVKTLSWEGSGPESEISQNPTRVASADDPALDISTVVGAQPGSGQLMVAQEAARSFAVVHLHGLGGTGMVSLAKDQILQRPVAIKQIRTEQINNAHIRERFLKEATITGQLEHPGIVPIHGLERDADGNPFLVMRFIQGRTLGDAIAAHYREPTAAGLSELLRRFESICQTLAYAHSKGVVHRDLKPMNIMLGNFGETLVLDWGLAKQMREPPQTQDVTPENQGPPGVAPETLPELDQLTTLGHALGTPGYMAPEQARGEEVDERADVFGLGAILCHILTGRPAVLGSNPRGIIEKTGQDDLAETHQRLLACGADADLSGLALACLTARREDRLPHAGVVAQRLGAYLASVQERLRTAEMESAKAQAKAGEERKRRRITMALAAALVVLVAGAAVVWMRYEKDQTQRRHEVETTLHNGQNLLQKGHFADAESAWQRGLELTKDLRGGEQLASALQQRLGMAQRAKKAHNLHELANLLHFYSVQESLPTRVWHLLNAGCRHQWQDRAFLLRPAAGARLEQKLEQGIQEDLLTLAILWGELQVRDAKPANKAAAQNAALNLLVEAEKESGINVVLLADQLRRAQQLGRKDLVAELAERIDRAESQTAWDYYGLGRTFLMSGDLVNAREHFERALELEPQSFAAHFLSGVCAYRQGRGAEALSAFSFCIGQEPKAECYYYRGLTAAALGQNDQAVRDFDLALEKQPALGPAYLQRGLVHVQEKRWEAAARDLKQALAREADPAATHYHLALVLVSLNDLDQARSHLRHVLKLQPGHKEALGLQSKLP